LQRRARPVDVFLGPLCSQWYLDLPQGEIRKKVDSMLDTLRERWDAGDHIRRSMWPRQQAYSGITNLWRYDLDREMRATYTIRSAPDGRIKVEVIEIFEDHKSYDKRMGYHGS